MSAVRATSAAPVRTAAARGAALAVLAVLTMCAAGVAGALGVPGPALTGALLLATGGCGVLYAVRPR
ncbi:hypothetical protein ABZZ36_13350 [Actinacidiphila glaucinigra]|uniref:hypothetical protein n=1 Tax=Actinacidiphila glaucinigra TaxID=235986 RepID=UPI0033AD62B9